MIILARCCSKMPSMSDAFSKMTSPPVKPMPSHQQAVSGKLYEAAPSMARICRRRADLSTRRWPADEMTALKVCRSMPPKSFILGDEINGTGMTCPCNRARSNELLDAIDRPSPHETTILLVGNISFLTSVLLTISTPIAADFDDFINSV